MNRCRHNPPCQRREYWGRGGAGVLFTCSEDGTVLLLLRAAWVEQGGTWGIPGGGIGEGFYRTPVQPITDMRVFLEKAKEEVEEECGSLPPGVRSLRSDLPFTEYEDCGFRYVTFILDITRAQKDAWAPFSADGENDAFVWFPLDAVKKGRPLPDEDGDEHDIHFGVTFTMGKLPRANPRPTTAERTDLSPRLTAREAYEQFNAQTSVFDEGYYDDLFHDYPAWELVLLDPATIESYTEPGAIQRGFSDSEDEKTARRYMQGIENAPPIIVRPYPHPPFKWLHMDGQTRARAALLSGKKVWGYAPVVRAKSRPTTVERTDLSPRLTAREAFEQFSAQTGVDERWYDLFRDYPAWELVALDPATIESYTEGGSIQRGFRSRDDEKAARMYASRGVENASPIFVRPYPLYPPIKWLLMDGQLRARAAVLSGKKVWGYAPVARVNPRPTTAERTDPALWEAVKREVTAGSKGGVRGEWSARKAQLSVALYKQRGGGYLGPKSPTNSLVKWTREDWRTRSGKPSLVTGERYLPSRAIAALTPAEYAATTRAKRAGMRKGQQFVPQPERIREKAARYRKNPDLPTAQYDALAASLRAATRAGHLDYPHDRDAALREWASEHGVAFLGAGMHRVVFRVPQGALKLSLKPVWHDRMYGNLAESRVWAEAPPTLRKHLVPVLAVADDGAWLLQEYAPTTGRERTPKEQRNVDAMWKAMSRCGYMDFQGNNIADDGRLLDYGSAEYPEMWNRCLARAASKKANPARRAREAQPKRIAAKAARYRKNPTLPPGFLLVTLAQARNMTGHRVADLSPRYSHAVVNSWGGFVSAGVTPEAAVSLALARVESLDDLARNGTLALDTVVYHGERAVAPWRDGYTMYVSTDKEYAKDYGDVVATPLRSLLGMGIFLGPDEDNVGGDVATDDLSSPAERSRREWYMDYEAGTGKPSLGWWTRTPTNGFTLTGDLASARKVFAPVRANPARRAGDKGYRKNPDPPDTAAFRRWFGASKVVDAEGKPLVVYHGTVDADFDTFKADRGVGVFFTADYEAAQLYAGSWDAGEWTGDGGDHRVYRVYLRILRPLVVDAKGASYGEIVYRTLPARLRETIGTPRYGHDRVEIEDIARAAPRLGYDGVIVRNVVDDAGQEPGGLWWRENPTPTSVYVVFDSTQIKSANRNVGTFDPADPRITHNPRRRNPSPREAEAMRALRANLTPDLLAGEYRACAGQHPMAGHCSVATEALYFTLGGKTAGYTPMNVRHEGVSHWYLRTPDGRYLDPTADQFDTPVDYASGRGRGFPTPRQGHAEPPPSKRAATLLQRLGARKR